MNFKQESFFKIALVQVEPRKNPYDNIRLAEEASEYAYKGGASLIVFPEMFMACPPFFSSLKDIAQPIDGEFVNSMLKIAGENQIFLASTFWETGEEDKVYNTAFLCSPYGELISVYRKLHLFDAFNLQESQWMIAGKELPEVVEIQGIKVALTICYDIRFPELYRYLARSKTHLTLVLSAWYKGILKEDHWMTLLRARAIENTFYMAGVGCIGKRFCGRSAVVDPYGIIMCEAGEEEKIIFADISKRRVDEVRRRLPSIYHVREDILSNQKE